MAEVSFTVRTDILIKLPLRAARGTARSLAATSANTTSREQAFLPARQPQLRGTPFGARRRLPRLGRSAAECLRLWQHAGQGRERPPVLRLRLAANAQASMRLYIAGGYPSRSKAKVRRWRFCAGRPRRCSKKSARALKR